MRIGYNTFARLRAKEREIGSKDDPPTGTDEQQMLEAEAVTRRAQAENIIKNHVMIALPFGLVPVPLFDLALLTGNQVKMVHALSKVYGRPFAKDRAKAIVLSLVGGSAPVLGVLGLSAGAKFVPGIGTLVGSGGVALSGGAMTYAVGWVFVDHLDSGGTLLDFDLEKAREAMRREFEKGREAIARMRHRANTSEATAGPD
jgi:uncharacterized protein (DUF697 family)